MNDADARVLGMLADLFLPARIPDMPECVIATIGIDPWMPVYSPARRRLSPWFSPGGNTPIVPLNLPAGRSAALDWVLRRQGMPGGALLRLGIPWTPNYEDLQDLHNLVLELAQKEGWTS